MAIDDEGKQAALRIAFEIGTITVKDTLKIIEAYEVAKTTDQPFHLGMTFVNGKDTVDTVTHLPTEQPVECSRSVILSLKAAMALTKKYLFLVGEQKIGDKEIMELRETRYQVENALDELQRAPKRESGEVPGWFNKSAAMADAQKVCDLTEEVGSLRKQVEKWHSAAMKAGVIVHVGGALSVPNRNLSSCDRHAETMPHFTLLAKDNLALGLVQEWIDRAQEEDVPPEKLEAALETRTEMAKWRKENKHLCKLPD